MVDQQHCLVESGQRLENVHQTHLTLASGNLVLKMSVGNGAYGILMKEG